MSSTPEMVKTVAAVGRTWRTLHTQITKATAAGATREDLARAMRVEPGILDAVMGGPAPAAASSTPTAPPKTATVRRELDARTIPAGIDLTDGDTVTSRRLNRYSHQPTAWVTIGEAGGWGVTDTGEGFRILDDTAFSLLIAVPHHVTRVYVLGGPEVLATGPEVTRAAGVRAWFRQQIPEGWAHAGHYLADTDAPVGRWKHADGHTLTLYRAAVWVGEGHADTLNPHQMREVMSWLSMELGTIELPGAAPRRPAGATWLATPATTGRDLMLRMLPPSAAYPVLSPELRQLIKATSGQGRSELLPPTAATKEGLPSLHYWDGRMMYAGLVWGMPDGRTRLWSARELDALTDDQRAKVIGERSRWRITYTVPRDWNHVGLLPTPDGGKWSYPSAPGHTATTWAEGSEVRLALQQGWGVKLHEGMSWGETKALYTWQLVLMRIHDRISQTGLAPELHAAARACIRSIILMGIGALAPRGHQVTKHAVHESDIPRGVEVRPTATGWEWEEEEGLPAWTRIIARTEWAATIWGRSRVRLLEAPTGAQTPDGRKLYAGALQLPREEVIGFRTDAIYTVHNPEWKDDGKPGRFRLKGRLPGPIAYPRDYNELFQLRDRAEEYGA